jgi:hypothetical protein
MAIEMKRKDDDIDRIKEGSAPTGALGLGRELYAYVPALFHVADRHVAGAGKISGLRYLLALFVRSQTARKGKRVARKICTWDPPPPTGGTKQWAHGMDHHSLEMFIFSAPSCPAVVCMAL